MKTSTIPSRTLTGAGCTLALSLAFALKASAATIDFENLPGMPNAIVPVPVASQLSDQFLSTLGVRFSSGSPYVAVVNIGGPNHTTSGFNAIGGSTSDGLLTYDAGFPIVATFFDPNDPATPATTDFVSLRIDFAATSGRTVTLNAFNLNGQLIDSFVTPDIGGATLQVSAPGIHSVQFIGTTDSTGAAVDDFAFNQVMAVPPIRLAIERDGSGGLFIRFTGAPNATYRLQRATSLTGPWTSSTPQTAPASGLVEFWDLFPPPGQAFYRTVQP